MVQGQCVGEGCACPPGLIQASPPKDTPPVCCDPSLPTFCNDFDTLIWPHSIL
jgi:hypothetical protein